MDLETNLRRLSARIDHPRLSSIDDRILAGIHARRLADQGGGIGLPLIAGVLAVLIGVASTHTLEAPIPAPALSPLGSSGPLAPSTLLATDR